MRRVVDAVLTLARRPREAVVIGDVAGWTEGLVQMGIDVVEPHATRPVDLVVAPAERLDEAMALGARHVIAEGPRAGVGLRGHGYAVRRFLPVPDGDRAEVLLPLSSRRQLRYGFDRSPPSAAWKLIRNRIAVRLLAAGVAPPRRTLVAVASPQPDPPFMIAEASKSLGLPPQLDWLLFPAAGDSLSRGTFLLFATGRNAPEWALKFARVPGYSEAFDRDERGLRNVEQAGAVVSAHAPTLLGRLVVDGLHASVETAAVGRSLVGFLGSRRPRRSKLTVVEDVARWLVDVAAATASSPERLVAERDRIKAEVLPRAGLPAAIVDDMPPVPGVLQHNDLGTWNIVVDSATPASFTALDWESARPVGLPLWDLWYFLQDALGVLDGFAGLSDHDLVRREAHALRLFRGELSTSEVLFEWTRRAVAACGIPDGAVGSLATLCFVHHGLSHATRAEAVRRHTPEAAALDMLWPRLAKGWLEDPALGVGWTGWR